MHDGERMVHKAIKFVPGLYKIFDEILVNAADNKVRDPTMDTLRVDIDPVSAAGGWQDRGRNAGPVGSMVPAGGRWGSGRAAWCASNGLANNLHAPLARCSSVAILLRVCCYCRKIPQLLVFASCGALVNVSSWHRAHHPCALPAGQGLNQGAEQWRRHPC